MSAGLHVVVQAGGRGSRLRHHTWNKPKCLVAVSGKPILYHLFDQLAAERFVIIGDYAFETLSAYLDCNPPPVACELVRASGGGTLGGLGAALDRIPADAPVLVVWSDLKLDGAPELPADASHPVVGLTDDFVCRWSLGADGRLAEVSSNRGGVPGVFYLPERAMLPACPPSGEFVKWFAQAVPDFGVMDWPGLSELGDFAEIERINQQDGFARYFNTVELTEDRAVKTARSRPFAELIEREIAWYADARALGFERIPKVLSTAPFTMERIRGRHPHQMADLTPRERRAVVADMVESLKGLHRLGARPAEPGEVLQVYLEKTRARVASVKSLIPLFERRSVTINGLKCRNPFAPGHESMLADVCAGLDRATLHPIHGDPTFSNTLVDENLRAWFIDPRGYFASSGVNGDPLYDFAKIYYSAVGGYDAFNRRQFKLHLDDETVEILQPDPEFAGAAEAVFADYFGDRLAEIRSLHALIWFALTGYARDDVDSVIAAFYLGAYWLERAGA